MAMHVLYCGALRWSSPALILGTLLAGLYAARLWYASSLVEPEYGFHDPTGRSTTFKRFGFVLDRSVQSGDEQIARINEIGALSDAAQRAGGLNKTAALWTAASVLLGTLAACADKLAAWSTSC